MATYSLTSIDEAAFDRFVANPAASQLQCIAEQFDRAGLLDAPPRAGAPLEWLRRRVAEPDWYAGLTEEEMQAWEDGIKALLEQPPFALKAHGFHCAVSDMFISIAADAYERRGAEAVVRQFWPYRFFDRYDLDYRGYFPTHALLTNRQVGRLLDEVGDYDALLDELAADKADFVDRWREQIEADREEAMPALRAIHEQKRMWYAQLDY